MQHAVNLTNYMTNKLIHFSIALLLYAITIVSSSAQSDDYRNKEAIDAAFMAELINLGFEDGQYPDVAPAFTVNDNLILTEAASALAPDESIMQGHVPTNVTTEDVMRASALACAASINQLKMAANGDLSNIRKIANIRYKTLTVKYYFDYIPASNSCSEMMLRVFGDTVGSHTRHAEGQATTKDNQTFQIEMYVYLK